MKSTTTKIAIVTIIIVIIVVVGEVFIVKFLYPNTGTPTTSTVSGTANQK